MVAQGGLWPSPQLEAGPTLASTLFRVKKAGLPEAAHRDWMLVFEVAGLPEGRPRVSLGDVVFLR